MFKKFSKIILSIVLFISFQNSAHAASLSISASSRNVIVGSNVTVTIKASDLAGTFNIKSSNSSVLSGGASNSWIENGSVTYSFKAKKTGSATVTVSTVDVSDFSTAGEYKASKSVTINVSEPVNYSKNNYLKSLSIEGAKLDFSKEKTSYSVNIEKGKNKITINGTADDSKAKVSGLGEKTLEEGDNYFEIKVTAENGSTRTYKINAILEEANPINVKIDDSEYRVIKKASLLEAKEGYKEDKVTIDGIEVPALKNEINNLTLIGLKDNEGNTVLAIYDNGNYEIYKELEIGNLKLLQLEFPKDLIKTNYEKDEITYNDEIINVYKMPEVKDLYFIYAMNLETGQKNVYRYDDKEKTIQRTIEYQEKETVDQDKIKDIVIKVGIIIGCAVLSFIVIIITMAVKIKKINQ